MSIEMDLLLKVVENNLDKVRENLFKNAHYLTEQSGAVAGFPGVEVVEFHTTDDSLLICSDVESGNILDIFNDFSD